MTSEKVAELIGLRVSITILFFGVVPGYTGILPVPSFELLVGVSPPCLFDLLCSNGCEGAR